MSYYNGIVVAAGIIMIDAILPIPLNLDYLLYCSPFFRYSLIPRFFIYLIFSLTGSVLGYYFGYYFDIISMFHIVFAYLLNINFDSIINTALEQFKANTYLFILLKPLIPALPFALINNIAGHCAISFPYFLSLSFISRIIKFSLLIGQKYLFNYLPFIPEILQIILYSTMFSIVHNVIERYNNEIINLIIQS